MTIRVEGAVCDRISGEGIEGVPVTDGAEIVRTGKGGMFQLETELAEPSLIWISVPEGWRTAGDFYQTASGGEEVRFALEPAPERQRREFRLAQITDTHVVTEGQSLSSRERLVEDLRVLVGDASPDLILASGDLTNRGTVEELSDLKRAIESIPVPIFPHFGGHDGNEERFLGGDPSFIRNFEQVLGPTYFSFDWGGRHFAFYPTEEYFFSERDQERKKRWFRRDLEMQPEEREIVVVTHTPPTASLLRQLGDLRVRTVLYGHWHSSKAFSWNGIDVLATPPLCFGGIDTEPRGFRLVDFGDRGMRSQLRGLQSMDLHPENPPEVALGEKRLELAWVQEIDGGAHRAAPVVREDSILLSLRDEENGGKAGVICLNADSGETRWRMATDASVKNEVALAGEGACAALAITGRLYLMEGREGRIRWQVDLPGYPERWLYTAPVAAEGVVYAGGKGGYGAYREENGEELWYAPLESSDNWSCYAKPRIYGDLLIALVQRRGLLALDRHSGKIAWEREMGVEYQYGTPVLAGDLLISGGDARSLAVLTAERGELVWHEPVLERGYATGLAVADDRIYATTSEGEVRCHALDSGALRWAFQAGMDLLDMTPYRRGIASLLGGPVIWEEKVVVGGNDGVLYILDGERGALQGKTSFGAPLSAPPLALEDGLCVGTWDGRVCSLRER